MKRLIGIIQITMAALLGAFLSLLAVGAIITPVALLTGCASAEKAAYTVTSASYTTVDSAMQAWGNYVAQFHPGVAAEQKVKAIYEQYQASARTVADAGLAYRKAVDSSSVDTTATKAALDQALAVASSALGNLVQVLATFGINLKIA